MNYDSKEIKKLFKDFYTVTAQRIALFDSNFEIVTKYPDKRCDFCEHIRSTPHGHVACTHSDRSLLEEASKGETIRCRCHAGLLEVCAPIIDDMGIIGYLMFGQILYDSNVDAQHKNTEELTKKYFSKALFKEKISSVRTLSTDYIDSVESIMTACISYIHLNKILNATKTGLWAQIDYYIDRNFASNFSLEEMAEDLGVSVSSICKTVKKYSGSTIHQLITEMRLKKAKSLLISTDMNINEIAFTVGIHDYNYFTKLFKKNEKITPSEYRKSHDRL